MESFGNFMKAITDTLNITQITRNEENTSNSDDRRNSNFSESGYGTDISELSNADKEKAKRAARMNAIKNKAREDDDEEFEVRGARNNRGRPANRGGFGMSTGAMVGLAALAIGGYAIGKALLTEDVKLQETPEDIIKKIKEIEEDTKECPVVGFDCQWSITLDGSRRNKIALVQIASHKGKVLLIQMSKLYTYPEEFKALLRNRNIIKSGIEVLKDARYLLEDYGLVVAGTFDIRFLAEETGHRPQSLAKLAHKILDMEIDRDWDLVASDWNKEKLDNNQIAYAEKAVKASVDIFTKLIPFVITKVDRAEILNYCAENLDRTFVFYSQNN